ncbi:hypothetical protein ACJX0J_032319, partial [Zea mays]
LGGDLTNTYTFTQHFHVTKNHTKLSSIAFILFSTLSTKIFSLILFTTLAGKMTLAVHLAVLLKDTTTGFCSYIGTCYLLAAGDFGQHPGRCKVTEYYFSIYLSTLETFSKGRYTLSRVPNQFRLELCYLTSQHTTADDGHHLEGVQPEGSELPDNAQTAAVIIGAVVGGVAARLDGGLHYTLHLNKGPTTGQIFLVKALITVNLEGTTIPHFLLLNVKNQDDIIEQLIYTGMKIRLKNIFKENFLQIYGKNALIEL